MLVGMTPPTSGTATMPGGMKITENMPAIRKCLGVCPQHDILFAELTALQHLQVSFDVLSSFSVSLIKFHFFSSAARSSLLLKVFLQVK
jgi:hypothetical protein